MVDYVEGGVFVHVMDLPERIMVRENWLSGACGGREVSGGFGVGARWGLNEGSR